MAAQPIIVIVGETASGKSALAMELAERFDGEIICADSRTVYKGMDIGTAKPTLNERSQIKHHLLDIVEPDEHFTVADFKKLANQAILAISKKGKLPIMVGGSGLYIDAVLFDFGFAQDKTARNPLNPRHLDPNEPKVKQKLRPGTLIIGLKLDKEILEERIKKRVGQMFDDGLVAETRALAKRYNWDIDPMQTPGYKAVRQYLNGVITIDQTKDLFIRSDLQLAKKQRTWFKRNDSIQWVDDPIKAVDIATTYLNKLQ